MSVEIGTFLRQTRKQVGLSLEEVQEKTKIQISFLEAIENGEFHKLPSPFYVRTYLRSYANCLKIEPQHILRQYRKQDQEERLHYGMQDTNPNEYRVGPASSTSGHNRSHSDLSKTREPNKNKRLNPQTAMIVSSKPFSYANTNANATTRLNMFQTQQINTHFTEQSNREIAAAREESLRKNKNDFLKQRSVPPSPKRPRNDKLTSQPTSRLNLNKINQNLNQGSNQGLNQGLNHGLNQGPNQALNKGLNQGLNKGVNQSKNSTDIFPAVRNNLSSMESSSTAVNRKKGSTNPQLFSQANMSETEPKTDDSLFPARGRSKGTQKPAGKRNSILFIALAVICIPLFVLGYVLFGTDEGETSEQPEDPKKNESTKTAPSTPPTQNNPSTQPSTRLIKSETAENTYYLEGGKELDVMIEADGEEVWIGISKKESKKNLIKDITLKPGEAPFEMVHLFEDTSSLYIYLGRPHSTKVSINNESIDAASVIKIKKR